MADARHSATLRSVAQAVGVHVSTASRALNPATRHLVAPEVADRIAAAARLQGYRGHAGAAALRTRRSGLVGIVVPDIANPVFGPILGGLEEALSQEGYSVLVANAASAARQGEAVDELLRRRVDGLVLATVAERDEILTRCIASGVPTVLVNRAEERERASAAVSDDRLGLRLAVTHLVALGHREIGYLGGPEHLSTGLLRRRGYEDAMAEAGLPRGPVSIASAYSRDAGRIAAAALLAAGTPTAIATANDLLALGAYEALRDRGLSCPGDVSVTGHNDMPLVDMIDPPLTTVRIPQDAIGRLAADLVVRRIAEPGEPARRHTVAPHLITRRSTAPRRPA